MKRIIKETSTKDQFIAKQSLIALQVKDKFKPADIDIVIDGRTVEVPKKALDLFMTILNTMAEGKVINVVASDSDVTTQQAADLLNVSRPHIVKLLDGGSIPFKKVGKHRRIKIKDLQKYDSEIQTMREITLKTLASQAQELDMGY